MKRFLGNLLWLVFALPFYVIILLMCTYSNIILPAIGIIFSKTTPYHLIDKIEDYINKQVKEYLVL